MKQRVTSLDLFLLVQELQPLITHRLAGIHDITSSHTQFLFKFALPDSKHSVVIDPGFAAYLTDYTRPVAGSPSGFVAKLRKSLKTRRLTSISQLGGDRVIVMQFSEGLYTLVIELFGIGNVILLDEDQVITAVLKKVDGVVVGEKHAMQAKMEGDVDINVNLSTLLNGGKTIQKALFSAFPYFTSDFISKVMVESGLDPKSPSSDFADKLNIIGDLLKNIKTQIESIKTTTPHTGYIITKPNPHHDSTKSESLAVVFDQFHPFNPTSGTDNVIEVTGYNATLDQFFSTIESSKHTLKIQSQEHTAAKKLQAAKDSKAQQLQALIDSGELNQLKGETVIYNADLVSEVIDAVTQLIDQGMDWGMIGKLIELEKKKGSATAKVIESLNLADNEITVKLHIEGAEDSDSSSDSESDDSDSDSDEEKQLEKPKSNELQTLNIKIDLSLSPYANASKYFTTRKSTHSKAEKVQIHSNKAIKAISNNINKSLSKLVKQQGQEMVKLRQPFWFEKFGWCFTDEGYLMLYGKDLTQTRTIYAKYVQDGDIYVGSDAPGAAHVWVLNPLNHKLPAGETESTKKINWPEVSPSTILQAATFSLSTSKLWESNKPGEAHWSFAGEVSLVDSQGDELRDGVRIIGQKRDVVGVRMVMGLGFVWTIKNEDGEEENEEDEHDEHYQEEENDQDAQEATTGKNDSKHTDLEEDSAEEQCRKEGIEDIEQSQEQGKGDSKDNSEYGEPEESISSSVQDLSLESTPEPGATQSTKQKKPIRGKKGKLRKMAQKYAYQDEEERELRMAALGTLKGKERELELKRQEEQERLEKERRDEERRKAYLAKQNSLPQKPKGPVKKERVNFDKLLNSIAPTPTVEDLILHAVPTFGPWQSLSRSRYRVKVQPGTTKKGKAVKEMMEHLLHRPTDSNRKDRLFDFEDEHDILKGVRETEILSVVGCGGRVRVALPQSGDPKLAGKRKVPGKKKGKK